MSIAYHLAIAGHPDVLVLERDLIGDGTTATATGGFRQQFSSPINARLSQASVEYFTQFADLVGEPLDLRQHGYLMVTGSEETLASAARSTAMQRDLGIPASVVTPAEISELHSAVAVGDLVGGTYCPTDGSASPADLVQAFARAARRAGVTIRQRTTVIALDRDPGGAVTAVRTPDESIEVGLVINAAGPWAGGVCALVDEHLPLKPTPRQAIRLLPADWMSPQHPFTVDLDSGAYLHTEVSGAVLGGTDRDRQPGMDPTVDNSLIERLLTLAEPRFPGIATVGLGRPWCGLREMTPDDHALVGPMPRTPGLWVAAGFSGHGFMHAPAIGRELAALLLTGSSGIDLSPLLPDRFSAGGADHETVVF